MVQGSKPRFTDRVSHARHHTVEGRWLSSSSRSLSHELKLGLGRFQRPDADNLDGTRDGARQSLGNRRSFLLLVALVLRHFVQEVCYKFTQ